MQHSNKLIALLFACFISTAAFSQSIGPQPIPSGLPPTGAAGGVLSGTYPNPGLASAFTSGIGFSTTNTLDIGTNATTLAPRTVYAGTSFVGPVGTFTTSATIGGQSLGSNTFAVNGNSLFSNNAAAVAVIGNGIDLVEDGVPAAIAITNYGTSGITNSPGFFGIAARGSLATPAALQTNDVILSLGARGYKGTLGITTSSTGSIRIVAAENWSNTKTGTYIAFRTATIGGTTNLEHMRITDVGNIQIGNGQVYGVSSGTDSSSAFDVNISRNGAGILQIGTTAQNALGSLLVASTTIGAGSAITSSGPGGALVSTAFTAIGTSGATVPLLSTANTWSNLQTLSLNSNVPVGWSISNTDSGTGAITRLLLTSDGGSTGLLTTSSTYVGVSGWADSFVISAANLSGGIQFAHDGVTKMTIAADGTILIPSLTNVATTSALCYNTSTGLITYNSTVGTCTVSASRYKIEQSFGNPGSVAGLTPRRFTYRDPSHGVGERIGFFAEDICKLDEALCIRNADGEVENYDERGVIALLVKEVKELRQLIKHQ